MHGLIEKLEMGVERHFIESLTAKLQDESILKQRLKCTIIGDFSTH